MTALVICVKQIICAMNKILIFAVSLSVVIFASRQTYLMVRSGGNLNLYAYNSSDEEIVTLETFVDGKSVNIQDYSNRKTLDDKALALYKSTDTYEVKVVAAKYDISETIKFNLIMTKWINIEFANDETDPDKYVLHLSLESSPNCH